MVFMAELPDGTTQVACHREESTPAGGVAIASKRTMATADPPFPTNHLRAAVAGLVAGASMSIVMAAARQLGVRIELERMLITLFMPDTDDAFGMGVMLHMVISCVIGVGYVSAARTLFHRLDWWVGVGLAPIHATVLGVLLAFTPRVHPRIPSEEPAPGLFLSNAGPKAVAVFLGVHLLFGALVGLIYTTRFTHPPAPATPIDA